MSTLETALRIAAEAQEGQTDKAGGSYVLHPIRMALSLYSPDEWIGALLHDVVEDCPGWRFARIASYGFGPDIIAAIKSVAKDPQADLSDEDEYVTFVARAAGNPIGRSVKLADLRDNCDLSRIPEPKDRDRARVEKYNRAIELMKGLEWNAGDSR